MSRVDLKLPAAVERAVRVRLARLDAEGFGPRLERRDATLWGDDPARQKTAANRLGWLDAPAMMRPQTATLRAFAQEIAAAGFTHAVLLGMGGSSLAPEVFRLSIGPQPGFLELDVLDNTSPAAVKGVLGRRDPRRTLFLVASKSGTTIEVSSFERVAYAWVQAARGDETGQSFVAITDPGTPLERHAHDRRYRRVFLNPPDIGGRYSALSCFGLVPAALMGADLDAILDAALVETRECGADVSAEANPALRLGVALAELARAGRDKVTLFFGPPLESLGSWVEQLLAESTGKEGRGLVPIVDEPEGPPEVYGNDRVFVSIAVEPLANDRIRRLDALHEAGHPVITWSRPSVASLGAEFVRWELATAVAGAVLGIDPFDEPNVAEAKQATQALLQGFLTDGALPRLEPLASARGIEASAPAAIAERLRPRVADPSEPRAWVAALAALAQSGDYLAVLAFLLPTPERRARLQKLCENARHSTGLATTLGFGPRFLHSTGQLHKGGPDRGIFLQLVADEGDLPIPGERYGFRVLRAAQALGDYQVLERRGRRVLRLDLGSDVARGLDELADALAPASRT
jgi:transaldolase/glucose-6-phosphate isomerase